MDAHCVCMLVGLDLQQQAFKYLRVQTSQHLYERVVFNLHYCAGS